MTQHITYEIQYFDKDLAERFYWTEAKSEKEAMNRFRLECNVNTVKSVSHSKYTIDELLALD